MRMSTLPILKPREVVHALKRMGFIELRSKGSHLQMKKGNLLVTVPMHSTDINQETLKSILRQAHLNIDELSQFI